MLHFDIFKQADCKLIWQKLFFVFFYLYISLRHLILINIHKQHTYNKMNVLSQSNVNYSFYGNFMNRILKTQLKLL